MRIRKLVGPIVVVVFLLFITSTYVAYSDKVEAMQLNGTWTVELVGGVYLSGGQVYAVISTFDADYDSTPDIPSYTDYLNDMLSVGNSGPAPTLGLNQTFVDVRIRVVCEYTGLESEVLLDDTINVAYLWAGGYLTTDGQIASFDYLLGPYVANHEYSPYKLTATVSIEGKIISESTYVTIPEAISEGV
jgi:hypothetical protein